MEFKDHLISKEKAKTLQQEFIKTRGRVISKILDKEGLIKGEDCRDFWLPIDVLKEFILRVEKQAREKGKCKDLGIRIFSGAYPKNEKVKDAGYSTVFLMAGYNDNNKLSEEDSVKQELIQSKKEIMFEKSTESEEELILNLMIGGRPPKDVE